MVLPLVATVAGSAAAASEGGGFNPLDFGFAGTTFWTWVIFLLALPVMWKFVFGPIERTSTGKVQKFKLRERAQNA